MEFFLKYAHLFPELASGLVRTFELPLTTADSQTSIFAESTSGDTLTTVVKQLTAGDKVELEWLQIRVEMEAEMDEDRYRIVEQCQKLVKLDAAAEDALFRQFPKPQIMIPKNWAGAV